MLGLVAHALQLQAKALMDAGEALRTKEREVRITATCTLGSPNPPCLLQS